MVPNFQTVSSLEISGWSVTKVPLSRSLWSESFVCFSQAHAGIEHFGVDWNNNPLLLFTDMYAKEYAHVWTYQQAKAVTTTRQNVTMGLKKGNTVLLHFQYEGQLFQVILMMAGSVPGSKGGIDTYKLWKHVLPRSTEFAWIPC